MGGGEAGWCMIPQTNPSTWADSQTVWMPALNKQTTKGSLTPGVSLAGGGSTGSFNKVQANKVLKTKRCI